MKYQLQTPIHIAQDGRWLSPAATMATADDAILDDAMPAAGKRLKTCDLAMALLQPRGCLVAQMGKSRVLHFDREGDVQYDSRNEILDFGAKARKELITRFKPGDCLVLTLADRVDPLAMATIASDSDDLTPLLEKRH